MPKMTCEQCGAEALDNSFGSIMRKQRTLCVTCELRTERFVMTIEDKFEVKGRGLVVTGKIDSGTVAVGDDVAINGWPIYGLFVVRGVETHLTFDSRPPKPGHNIGLLLGDIPRRHFVPGDTLETPRHSTAVRKGY